MALSTWTYVPQGSGPPPLYGDTDYSEQLNSGNISAGSNASCTRIFFIKDEVIPSFLDALLGYGQVSNVGAVQRVLPDPHPVFNNMYASEATVERMGLNPLSVQYPNKTARSTTAKVTATYKPVDYEVVADTGSIAEQYRFVSRSKLPAGEYFSIDATGMYYCNKVNPDGKHVSLASPPGRITASAEITMTWHAVPPNTATSPFIEPNCAAITNCLGRVNSVAFDPAHYNYPAGTVLFMAAEPRMVANRVTTGAANYNYYYEITMKFLYRNNGPSAVVAGEYAGHQFVWDQANRRYDLITTTGLTGGNRLYETADLNTLFQIG